MATIQYSILRFLPDRVTEEFINLGVVAYDPASQCLRSRFITKVERANCLFPGLNRDFLETSVAAIKSHLDELSVSFQTAEQSNDTLSLDTILKTVLPPDDSSLFFSRTRSTLDDSIESAQTALFDRFINSMWHI